MGLNGVVEWDSLIRSEADDPAVLLRAHRGPATAKSLSMGARRKLIHM